MNRDIWIKHEGCNSVGIQIHYLATTREIEVSGFYDSFCALPRKRMTLADFLAELNISWDDLQKAYGRKE